MRTETWPSPAHLGMFCAVADCGSISDAARLVHRSQPAVSQGLRTVELALGAQLFQRSSSGVRLTAAGVIAEPRCRRLLEQLSGGLANLRRGRSRGDTANLRAISFTQLHALNAVVERGSFSAAAQALGQARASVHRAVRALEAALAVPLFEHTSFGLGSTRAATELARCAALASSEWQQARAEVAALSGGDRGITVIGAMPLARSVLVPRTVLAMLARYPRHRVAILDGHYDGMLAELRRGSADLLVGALREPAPGADVVQEHLFDDPLALVMRAAHPLARRRRPGVAQLASYPWIVARPGAPLHAQFDALFAGAGQPMPVSTIECNSMDAARALLLASDCLMLSSEQQLHHELRAGELRVLPHPLGPRVRAIGLTLRRDWRPTAAQQFLLDTLRLEARRGGGGLARSVSLAVAERPR